MNKIIIVGAVAGGATCASQIRRLDKESEIIVFEKDRDMSFANCALPYYIGNVIEDRRKVLAYTPNQFYDKKQITVKTYHEVIQINDEYDRVKQEFTKFRAKFRSFMNFQIDTFDDLEKDFIKNFNITKPEDQTETEEPQGIQIDFEEEKEEKTELKDIYEVETHFDDVNEIKSFFAEE